MSNLLGIVAYYRERLAHGYTTPSSTRSNIRDAIRSGLRDATILQNPNYGSTRRRSVYHTNGLRATGLQFGQALRESEVDEAVVAINAVPSRSRTTMIDVWNADNSDELFQCDCCAEAASQDDSRHSENHGETYCESCADSEWVYSDLMSDYIRNDDAVSYYETSRDFNRGNSQYAAEGCRELRNAREHDGDYFSEEAYYDLGYGDEDDCDEDEDDCDDGDSNIRQYHSSRNILGHIPSAYDKRTPRVLLGVELEIEVDTSEYRNEQAGRVLSVLNSTTSQRYCAAEGDGSLDHGFEIVTGFTGLDVHAKALVGLQSLIGGPFKSHDTKTCGLHVHVCKADMSPFHAAKLIGFIHAPANKALIKCVARRYGTSDSGSGYAKFDHGKNKGINAGKEALRREKNSLGWGSGKKSARSDALRNLNGDRYEALNFQNEKTVEFRLFKGSMKYETVMACLEFAFMSWHFTRSAGMSDLTDEAFCKFIRQRENLADSKFLRLYLKAKSHPAFVALTPVKKAVTAPAVIAADDVPDVGLETQTVLVATVNTVPFSLGEADNALRRPFATSSEQDEACRRAIAIITGELESQVPAPPDEVVVDMAAIEEAAMETIRRQAYLMQLAEAGCSSDYIIRRAVQYDVEWPVQFRETTGADINRFYRFLQELADQGYAENYIQASAAHLGVAWPRPAVTT